MPPLDARLEAQKLREIYSQKKPSVSILLTGDSGSGKTGAIFDALTPVHIDSFDPGGTTGIRSLITKGDVVAETRYEDEDPLDPSAFALWERRFKELVAGKYFESIACYWLDSATTWTEAIMNYVQKKRGAAGAVPEWNKDYHPQKIIIRNYLRICMNLPCHFVLTAHLEPHKDSEGNVLSYRVLFSGKGAVVIPLLFDEIWRAERKENSKGFDYRIHIQESGRYLARSRLAGKGLLDKEEPNNLRQILRKAGLASQDKPKLYE